MRTLLLPLVALLMSSTALTAQSRPDDVLDVVAPFEILGPEPSTSGSVFQRMGILGAGVAGAFIMALGTACVTIAAALASVALRESAFLGLSQGKGLTRALSLAEVVAGSAILLLATQMIRQGL